MPAKMRKFEPGHGFTKEDWDEVSDNPELTDEQLARGKAFAEAFPALAESIRRTRGKQKTPTKELVSLRLDRETIAAFRATGPGWQVRINAALRKVISGMKQKAPAAKPKKQA